MITKTEQRFREGRGARYMSDGQRVRCQAQSKNQLRDWRIKNQNDSLDNDAIWPECQCTRAAVYGAYACSLHGGLTPSKKKPESILDVIPYDLGEKLKIIMENPNYISSRTDIMLWNARQWELYEKLSAETGSKEDWERVAEARRLLKNGDFTQAAALLDASLSSHDTKRDVWEELHKVEKTVNELRSTEAKVAKEMRLMASAEQVERLMDRVFSILMRGIEKNVTDSSEQTRLIQYVIGELSAAINIGPSAIGRFLDAGSREEI